MDARTPPPPPRSARVPPRPPREPADANWRASRDARAVASARIRSEVTDRPPLEWLRIYDGGRCVAMAKVRRGLNRAVVHFITTHPGYRGRGLGRRLIQSLQEACDEVIARGVNYDARGFWRHLEFWREGQGHDYYWRRGGSP